jgi:hypothetical protein
MPDPRNSTFIFETARNFIEKDACRVEMVACVRQDFPDIAYLGEERIVDLMGIVVAMNFSKHANPFPCTLTPHTPG